jgi:hypothetical protein
VEDRSEADISGKDKAAFGSIINVTLPSPSATTFELAAHPFGHPFRSCLMYNLGLLIDPIFYQNSAGAM